MATPPTEGKFVADTAMPKPPLPSAFISRKSESFRGVPYSPPGQVEPTESQEQETAPGIGSFIRRFWSGGSSLSAHASSEVVVEELSRRSSLGRNSLGRNSVGAQRNGGELPPKPARASSATLTPVGLPSVTLVATDVPPVSKETGTSETNAEVSEQKEHQQTSIQKEEVVENKKEKEQTPAVRKGEEGADVVQMEKEERTTLGSSLPSEEPSVQMGQSVMVSVGGEMKGYVEREKTAQTETAVVIETPKIEAHQDIQSPPIAPVSTESIEKSSTEAATNVEVEKGAGVLEASSPTMSAPAKKSNLRKAETMPKPPQQPNFFKRILSLGRAGPESKPSLKEEEEEFSKEMEAVGQEEKMTDEESTKPSESLTLGDDPSGSQSILTMPDPAEAKITSEKMDQKTETAHDRTSSELTPTELDELKSSFMSEMRNKGIDVAGKYTKSSVDFDSPLMFLLDLHTFAVMQHSTVRMEDVLEERYGAAHTVVTEFSAATARQRETETQQLSSEQEQTVLPLEKQQEAEEEVVVPSVTKSTTEAAEPNKSAEKDGHDEATSKKQVEESAFHLPPAASTENVAPSKFEATPPFSEEVSTQQTYAAGLDSAQDTVTEEAKGETQGGSGAGGSSSGSQTENKKPDIAVDRKEKSKPSSEAVTSRVVQANSPTEIPPPSHQNESAAVSMPARCFMCSCFFPRANY